MTQIKKKYIYTFINIKDVRKLTNTCTLLLADFTLLGTKPSFEQRASPATQQLSSYVSLTDIIEALQKLTDAENLSYLKND